VLGVKLASQAMRRLRRFPQESLTPPLVSGEEATMGFDARIRPFKPDCGVETPGRQTPCCGGAAAAKRP
jgi:hypothetical protein